MSRFSGLQLRIAGARVLDALGAAGIAGLVLTAAAVVWTAVSWRLHHAELAGPERPAAMTTATLVQPTPPVALALPKRSEWAFLLTQIQQTVVGEGLAWPSADYKLVPASDRVPMLLEVRCNLKGSYPQLRRVMARLQTFPGLAIKELSMTRPASEAAEVDAKLALTVFMQDPADDAGDAADAKDRP